MYIYCTLDAWKGEKGEIYAKGGSYTGIYDTFTQIHTRNVSSLVN